MHFEICEALPDMWNAVIKVLNGANSCITPTLFLSNIASRPNCSSFESVAFRLSVTKKSTLLRVLRELWDPQDGYPVGEIPQRELAGLSTLTSAIINEKLKNVQPSSHPPTNRKSSTVPKSTTVDSYNYLLDHWLHKNLQCFSSQPNWLRVRQAVHFYRKILEILSRTTLIVMVDDSVTSTDLGKFLNQGHGGLLQGSSASGCLPPIIGHRT